MAWMHFSEIFEKRKGIGMGGLDCRSRCERGWRVECGSHHGGESREHFDGPKSRFGGTELALGAGDGVPRTPPARSCRMDGAVGMAGRRFDCRRRGIQGCRSPLCCSYEGPCRPWQTRVYGQRGRWRLARPGKGQLRGAVDQRCRRHIRVGDRGRPKQCGLEPGVHARIGVKDRRMGARDVRQRWGQRTRRAGHGSQTCRGHEGCR